MENIIALIPAAGLASRMNKNINKTFLEISGESIIRRTIKSFLINDQINEIYIMVHKNEYDLMHEHLADLQSDGNITIVVGGESRQESVRLGLEYIVQKNPSINFLANENEFSTFSKKLSLQHSLGRDRTLCLVHDGARCLVTQAVINDCIDKMREDYLGVGAAIPVTDTIHIVNIENEIVQTPNRSNLFAAQTPQGADFEILLSAHRIMKKNKIFVTDDISALKNIAYPVKVSAGDIKNIKITHPQDIDLAEKLLKNP